MPRPSLPKAEEIAGIARLLRAEGFEAICIETTPDGCVSIRLGNQESETELSALEAWRKKNAAA